MQDPYSKGRTPQDKRYGQCAKQESVHKPYRPRCIGDGQSDNRYAHLLSQCLYALRQQYAAYQ